MEREYLCGVTTFGSSSWFAFSNLLSYCLLLQSLSLGVELAIHVWFWPQALFGVELAIHLWFWPLLLVWVCLSHVALLFPYYRSRQFALTSDMHSHQNLFLWPQTGTQAVWLCVK